MYNGACIEVLYKTLIEVMVGGFTVCLLLDCMTRTYKSLVHKFDVISAWFTVNTLDHYLDCWGQRYQCWNKCIACLRSVGTRATAGLLALFLSLLKLESVLSNIAIK